VVSECSINGSKEGTVLNVFEIEKRTLKSHDCGIVLEVDLV